MLFIKFLECIFDSNILRCIDSLSLSRIMIFVYIFKKSIYNDVDFESKQCKKEARWGKKFSRIVDDDEA